VGCTARKVQGSGHTIHKCHLNGLVGAGEVRSGAGTLASPMVGRWEAAGEQDAGRPKGLTSIGILGKEGKKEAARQLDLL
jgi:hypothetical protein